MPEALPIASLPSPVIPSPNVAALPPPLEISFFGDELLLPSRFIGSLRVELHVVALAS
jgi:hypothetical protein